MHSSNTNNRFGGYILADNRVGYLLRFVWSYKIIDRKCTVCYLSSPAGELCNYYCTTRVISAHVTLPARAS